MPRDYAQTLQFLYARLPMFSRTGAAALKPGLGNTLALLDELGNPHKEFKSVHVAGTNGKGSVSHGLAAVLAARGNKTALYTSPHLIDLRERIRINGQMIPEAWIVRFVDRIERQIGAIEPSFFEIMVAAAFCWFAEEKVDVAVIETGLGGRLDSTNVITPLLSVITNIGLDHTDLLGNTLQKIAAEKAGIIKHRVPVVIGRDQAETAPVFEQKAGAEESPLLYAGDLFGVGRLEESAQQTTYRLQDYRLGQTHTFISDLRGSYQSENLATIVAAAAVLDLAGFNLPLPDVLHALGTVARSTGLRGRFETVQQNPLVIADVAHNKDGLSPLLAQVTALPHRQLHIVTGFVADKDVSAALSLFPEHAIYYWCAADLPRALPAEKLAAAAEPFGLSGTTYPSVQAATLAAVSGAADDDCVLITGSFFVVGEALHALAGTA